MNNIICLMAAALMLGASVGLYVYLQKGYSRLAMRLFCVRTELRTELDKAMEAQDELRKRLDELYDAVTPDDSAARKAKQEIDKFNEGIYNLLTYSGPPSDEGTRNKP